MRERDLRNPSQQAVRVSAVRGQTAWIASVSLAIETWRDAWEGNCSQLLQHLSGGRLLICAVEDLKA